LQVGWRKRWQQFRDMMDCRQAMQLYPKKLYGVKELLNLLKQAEQVACVGVTFMLSDGPDEQQILSEVLGAGIPVALWPRTSSEAALDADDVPAKIAAIITPENLRNLPNLVKEERLKATQINHLGNYLTLLWDDPDRLPPKQHLQSPQ
jgi:hypothetical protein